MTPTDATAAAEKSGDMMFILGQIKGGQDALLVAVGQQTERLNNHGERLGSLEKRQAWLMAWAIAGGAALGKGADFLMKVVA